MSNRILTLAALAIFALNCGTLNSIRPLPRDASAFALAVGGPVTNVSGTSFPLPIAVARYDYGLSDRVTGTADAHLLLPAFGVIGLDAKATWHFLNQDKWIPALGAGAGLNLFLKAGGGDTRVFPELSVHGSYLLGKRVLTYFGVQSLYQFQKPYVAWAPLLGTEVRLGRKLSFSLEGRWYEPGEITAPRLIDYSLPISGHGAVGFVLGVNYFPGGWYE